MNKYQRRLIEDKYGKITSFKLMSKWRKVYKLTFNNFIYRLDILKKGDKTLENHKRCLSENIYCFPEIRSILYSGDIILKISDWVVGETYSQMVLSGKLNTEMLYKMGSSIAKVNNIRKNELYLHNDDVTYHNVILDKYGKFMMFDLDRLSFVKDVDGALVKTLLKRIRDMEMINSFLDGYKKYRDIKNLSSLCEKRDWKWKWKK